MLLPPGGGYILSKNGQITTCLWSPTYTLSNFYLYSKFKERLFNVSQRMLNQTSSFKTIAWVSVFEK